MFQVALKALYLLLPLYIHLPFSSEQQDTEFHAFGMQFLKPALSA